MTNSYDRDALRNVVLNYGRVTDFNRDLPDGLTTSQYRAAIDAFVGFEETSINRFEKAALVELAEHLGCPLRGNESTRQLRTRIGTACGFDYESPSGHIRPFNKSELTTIALTLARDEMRRSKVVRTEASTETKPERSILQRLFH